MAQRLIKYRIYGAFCGVRKSIVFFSVGIGLGYAGFCILLEIDYADSGFYD